MVLNIKLLIWLLLVEAAVVLVMLAVAALVVC
jgi:hypothetical protein